MCLRLEQLLAAGISQRILSIGVADFLPKQCDVVQRPLISGKPVDDFKEVSGK
jgi:hypothetical protein